MINDKIDSLHFTILEPTSNLHGGGMVVSGAIRVADNGNEWAEAGFEMTRDEIRKTIELLQELLSRNPLSSNPI